MIGGCGKQYWLPAQGNVLNFLVAVGTVAEEQIELIVQEQTFLKSIVALVKDYFHIGIVVLEPFKQGRGYVRRAK